MRSVAGLTHSGSNVLGGCLGNDGAGSRPRWPSGLQIIFQRHSLSAMAAAKELPLNAETTEKFVKLCASTFGWEDLSEDTVMDVGCGKGLYCARTVLENFPNVKSIIALDGSPAQLEGITFKSPRITRLLADILKRTDIHRYEGKVDKVISTHVLHQIQNKEKVFKNVYRLLKPGGEAGFLFTSDFGLYHVLNNLRQDSKYKDYFKVGIDI
ncbi:hypothetical protein AVEN_244132-1 [Araneus ventricosus]|uniref:Methyltransferase domain-containing protein n=1 Tax=Araneus ventricosus TaxID=182803 RepID=A0A4Y2R1Q6_ARAVE|nr:hypothetical protein AVEN_244132-1 [Araneus ventricosus]